MAGYIFNIDKSISVEEIMKQGYYATFIKSVAAGPFEGTFGDFITMNEGDNVFFFQQRKIYGIGRLINIGPDCKYNNYPGASELTQFEYKNIKNNLIIDFGTDSPNYRWICFFDAAPTFMKLGLDMDEVLQYKPEAFKSIRTNWKRTFVKIDDEENKALKELFYLRAYDENTNYGLEVDNYILKSRLTNEHILNYKDIIKCTKKGKRLMHEMAVESVTLAKIKLVENNLFGNWDYLTHQVCASPFKPVDYMDKMDIFAYRYTEIDGEKVISKYMVIELKKDCANVDTIAQVTNYVDWICNKYAYGDYSLIEAYILASDFESGMLSRCNLYERVYNLGSHPIQVKKWNNLKFIKYKIINDDIEYEII